MLKTLWWVTVALVTANTARSQNLMDGDIIFILNRSTAGKELLPNGKGKFNYLGVIFLENNKPFVYHVAAQFEKTPLDEFLKLAEGDAMTKRLSEEGTLTADAVRAMRDYAVAKLGSAYDNQLNLNNDNLYNAEFAYKVYQMAIGLPLCIPRELKSYKLNNQAAVEFLKEAYGPAIMDEKIVTVGDIYQSQFLD